MGTCRSERVSLGDVFLIGGVWWTIFARLRDPKTRLVAVYLLSDDGAERVEWESDLEPE